MSGLFEHLAATDDSHIVAQRVASAVALKRVKDRFGAFFANAQSDLPARLALVEDEITEIVTDVVTEHGGDAQKIEAAIRTSMIPQIPGAGVPGAGGLGAPGALPGGAGAGATGQQTCPQCGGPMVGGQCARCQGGSVAPQAAAQAGTGAAGAAGAYGMQHSMPQGMSTGPITAKGAFCDDCRHWKSGPNAGCTCGTESESESEPDSDDEGIRESRHSSPALEQLSITTQPIMHAEPLPDTPGKEGVTDIDGELANAPSAVGSGDRSSSHKEAEALKTVDLPTGDASALGGPSPKIDKGNSGDQHGWNLEPIDTQMNGSPHPTVEQDPVERADYNKDDFLAQTKAVTKSESLPSNSGDAGFDGEREIKQYPTKTFPKGDQAKPVTNEALSSVKHLHGAIDPDKNPIQEIVDQYSGFLMPNQVEAALRDWDG